MRGIVMSRRLIVVLILAGILLGAAFVGAMAFNGTPVSAQSGDDGEDEAGEADDGVEGPDVPIAGSALERASAAALEYVGEGRVTGTEVGDEEGYYEVEITLANGRQVDVHLDETFNILGQEGD
jgi:hypothetical protein